MPKKQKSVNYQDLKIEIAKMHETFIEARRNSTIAQWKKLKKD